MAKILVCDYWKKFMLPVVNYWREQGHEVRVNMNWDPEDTAWADVAYFYPVQNNLRVASHRQKKPFGLRVVAEAVDIDIYSGGLGGINWRYVDSLIFMAEHKKALGLRKARGKIPEDLPIYVVPGGVDMDAWTLRRDTSRGFNVAWIGRLWVAKNVFGALQIFNQLVKADPDNPWKLFLRADGKLNPEWWRDHVDAYLEVSEDLRSRITLVPFQENLNEWLEDISFLLQTSMKEAFSYVSCQSAAKGIKVVMQMTTGMDQVWPDSWIFQTHDEAVRMFLGRYEPETYRAYVADRYPLSRRTKMLDEICGL